MNAISISSDPSYDPASSSEAALDWVKPYYSRAGEYWGPGEISDKERGRVAAIARLMGPTPKRILELGAGTGETAAAMADAGHSVVALEFSPTRSPALKQAASLTRTGALMALEADFYSVELPREFDLVCYWDGFGVGGDADQRRLLRRIADEWLAPDGCALIDVFSPFRWVRETGQEWQLDRSQPSHRFRQRRRFDYDPVQNCFLDEWCPIDDATQTCDESRAIQQRIRCYAPADLLMLLPGTGLSLKAAEVEGAPLDLYSRDQTRHSALWNAWSYLVQLAHTP